MVFIVNYMRCSLKKNHLIFHDYRNDKIPTDGKAAREYLLI